MKQLFITLVIILSLGLTLEDCRAADGPELQFTKVSFRPDVWDITNAGDGSGRLFLVRSRGLVNIIEDGVELETTFLNIQNRVFDRGEQTGLLSMTFAPDYESSGYFYVLYTAERTLMLDRYRVSDDPNVADHFSRESIMMVELTSWTNNGGRIRFGPDQMLYISIGDDGDYEGYDNPISQDGSKLNGKILRIDVDPIHGSYAIPPDNPFIANPNFLDEIWAIGLRNPFRISFDRSTGDLFIGDVGEERMQEIDFQAFESAGGENYGWNMKEGTLCVPEENCGQSGLTDPVAEYSNDGNGGEDNCWVVGGEAYRGQAYPGLHGTYLYGDYCSGNIWGLTADGEHWADRLLASTAYLINTFGQAEDGSIYMAAENAGVFLISDGEVAAEPDSPINRGHSGAWFNPLTSGQGQVLDIDTVNKFMFLAWFTFTDDASDSPNEQHWYTAQGNYDGDTAQLTLNESLGGKFDDPQAVDTSPAGSATVKFTDCETGQLDYTILTEDLQGSIPLARAIPGSGDICEQQASNEFSIESIDINAGMDGAWYRTTTPGQGFLIDINSDPENGNFIFVAWFTYGESSASGQRWFTAQGNFAGSSAELDVYETLGGSFDDPKSTGTDNVGVMQIEFTDCNNATLSYILPGDGVESEIAITRALPTGSSLCENLSSNY